MRLALDLLVAIAIVVALVMAFAIFVGGQS
jgi:hypothetical protein